MRIASILAVVGLATACTNADPAKAPAAASKPAAPVAAPAPAAAAPAHPAKMDFTLPVAPLKQRDLSFAMFRNRWTLVYYFLPTCGHCQHGWPWLQRMRATYEKKGLAVVAIASGSATQDDIQMFDTDFKLDVPSFQDQTRAFSNAFSDKSVPQIYLVKPDGSYQTWVGSSDSIVNTVEGAIKSGLHVK